MLEGSSISGEGYSIVAAHNTLNNTGIGPFAALSSLEITDVIFVNNRSGQTIRFSVYANELLDPGTFDAIEAIASKNPGSLVLVTCENESVDGG